MNFFEDNLNAQWESPNQRPEIWDPTNKPRNKKHKIPTDSPFGRIPNVREFKVIPGSIDWL